MPTNMHAPRGGRGLRDGMTVELHTGDIIKDVERMRPRAPRFTGIAVSFGPERLREHETRSGELLFRGDVVSFAQCNVASMWKPKKRKANGGKS